MNRINKCTRNSEIEKAYRRCKFEGDKIYSNSDITDIVNKEYPTIGSIMPSDYCYNNINKDKDLVKNFLKRAHFFEKIGHNQYVYLGENFKYTGDILYKNTCVGKWQNGEIEYLDFS